MMKKLTLVIATIIACTTFSITDIQAQGNRQSRFLGANQGRIMTPPMNLEQRVNTFAETLNLTDEHKTELRAFFESQMKTLAESRESMRDLAPRDRRTQMQKQRTAFNNKLKEILTEDQYKTYESSRLNRIGMVGFGNEVQVPMSLEERVDFLAKNLKLTDEQKNDLKKCLEDNQKEMQELFKKTSEMTPEKRRTTMQEMRNTHNEKIKKILGDDLYKKYQTLSMRAMRSPQNEPGPRPLNMGISVQDRVDRIAETVTLTDEQKTSLKNYFEEQTKSFEKNREEMRSMTPQERRSQMEKNLEEHEKKLKEILGEENYKKLMTETRNQSPLIMRGGREGVRR